MIKIIHIIGWLLILYSCFVTVAGPSAPAGSLWSRCVYIISTYRYLILIALIGSIMVGVEKL